MARPQPAAGRARHHGPAGRGVPDARCARSSTRTRSSCWSPPSCRRRCTDERVNLVTPALFARYPTPADLAAADLARSRSSSGRPGSSAARRRASSAWRPRWSSASAARCPSALEDLVTLPGVGRKTGQRGAQRGLGPARPARRHPRGPPQPPPGLTDRDRPGEGRARAQRHDPGRRAGPVQPAPDPPRPAGVRRPPPPLRGLRAQRLLPPSTVRPNR